MIRLIACDVDGTLIPQCSDVMDIEMYDVIRRLKKKGIIFCAASGRQHASLLRLFAPVADDIYFICENGAVVYGPGENAPLLGQTVMDRESCLRLANEIINFPQCEYLISGAKACYISPKRESYISLIRDQLHNVTEIVPAPEDIPEDILKVTAYCPIDIDNVFKLLSTEWSHLNPCYGGPEWIDMMLANKGAGLKQLCDAIGVDTKDVMAFGDNSNDLPMLETAGHSYIMEWANPDLLETIPNHCSSVKKYLSKL